MENNIAVGALMFVRDSNSYGVLAPVYRHRVKGSCQAFVLADSEDAKNYAERNNLVLVDREEKP